jgi:uncharacterized protein (DUF1778 family)
MQKEVKTQSIRIRVTKSERAMIDTAAERMHRTTGARQTISRVILQAVKEYLTKG